MRWQKYGKLVLVSISSYTTSSTSWMEIAALPFSIKNIMNNGNFVLVGTGGTGFARVKDDKVLAISSSGSALTVTAVIPCIIDD